MYICQICHYLPDRILDNKYFAQKTGLSEEDLFKKAGILTRRVCSGDENTSSMAIKAIEKCNNNYVVQIQDIDLIIGATYTPDNTLGTMAHAVQRHFDIRKASAFILSSACSSFVDAIEITQGYFAMEKASKVLVVASEHNSKYINESDKKAGHLWGDAAAAVFVSKTKTDSKALEILDVMSLGLGHIGKGPQALTLKPKEDGLRMHEGRDVFIHAVDYMSQLTKDIIFKNGFSVNDISYIVPHQANMRIIKQIAKNLSFVENRFLMNIAQYGNTGCVSTPLLLSEHWERFQPGELIVLSVFGGGYSAGAILMRVV